MAWLAYGDLQARIQHKILGGAQAEILLRYLESVLLSFACFHNVSLDKSLRFNLRGLALANFSTPIFLISDLYTVVNLIQGRTEKSKP